MSTYHERKCREMKNLLEYIGLHPEGVTTGDIKQAGFNIHWLGTLRKHGAVKGEQVRHPEEGPRNYHWIFKATGKLKPIGE